MLRRTVDERSGSSASLRQCAALPMLGRKVYLMRSESPFAIAGIGSTTRCWRMQGKSGGKQRRRRRRNNVLVHLERKATRVQHLGDGRSADRTGGGGRKSCAAGFLIEQCRVG